MCSLLFVSIVLVAWCIGHWRGEWQGFQTTRDWWFGGGSNWRYCVGWRQCCGTLCCSEWICKVYVLYVMLLVCQSHRHWKSSVGRMLFSRQRRIKLYNISKWIGVIIIFQSIYLCPSTWDHVLLQSLYILTVCLGQIHWRNHPLHSLLIFSKLVNMLKVGRHKV